MKDLLLLVSVLLLWLGLSCYAGPLQSSVVVIIRHGEKPDVGDGLAPAGGSTSQGLCGLFRALHSPFETAAATIQSRRTAGKLLLDVDLDDFFQARALPRSYALPRVKI
jgi:hypothetical protein